MLFEDISGLFHSLHRKGWETVFRLEEMCFPAPNEFQELIEKSGNLSVSNGCRFYSSYTCHVGIVCDEFVYRNYEPVCPLQYLPANWREDMLTGLDLVLVVSPWRGIDQSWTGVSLASSWARESLLRLLRSCRRRGIPAVFYSKEDPPNYHIFLPFAREAEVVFTSAAECIPAYQRDCGHDRVYPLLFAVNPLVNNPIEANRFKMEQNAVLFAGSWMKKYPQRIREQELLFQWIRKTGVPFHIMDRNSERRDPAYRYPIRWQKYRMPAVPYVSLPGMNKLHDWVLNLNSVTDSLSMFSMRVYDALACGCPVLSNESVGMERRLPEVRVIRSGEELEAVFSMTRKERDALRMAGIRRVMGGNTVFDRGAEFLGTCGVSAVVIRRKAAVLAMGSEEETADLRSQFQSQTYEDKLFITDAEKLFSLSGISAVALWKGGRKYDPFFLQDCMDAFKYTDCDWVTAYREEASEDTSFVFTEKVPDPCAAVFWVDDRSELAEILSPSPCAAGRRNGFSLGKRI